MRISFEISPEGTQRTTEKVARGTAIVVSSAFALTMSTVVSTAIIGRAAWKQLKDL